MPRQLSESIGRKRGRVHRLREVRPAPQPLIREDEIMGQLQDHGGGTLFLSTYTQREVERLLARFGVLAVCADAGFEKVQVRVETGDPFKHVMRLVSGEDLLAEIVLRSALFNLPELAQPAGETGLLVVEWILLQNPRAPFAPERTPLPGQRHPGLGLGARIVELLVEIARGLNLEGIVEHPQYYHSAVMYAKTFHFLHAGTEGTLAALQRDLASLEFSAAAWAVHRGLVREGRRKFKWVPEEQVMPVTQRLKDYFASDAYVKAAQEAMLGHSFKVRMPSASPKR